MHAKHNLCGQFHFLIPIHTNGCALSLDAAPKFKANFNIWKCKKPHKMQHKLVYLQFVFHTADFDWILEIVLILVFHINWHGMEMMNFETLMWNGMFVVNFMVMICFRFQWFRIMNNSGQWQSKQWAQNLHNSYKSENWIEWNNLTKFLFALDWIHTYKQFQHFSLEKYFSNKSQTISFIALWPGLFPPRIVICFL